MSEAVIARETSLPRRFLNRLFSGNTSQEAILMTTALVIGVGAGFGAIGFSWLIRTVQSISFGSGKSLLSFMGDYYVVIVPAAGGLLVGLLTYHLAREAKGHGVPEVMDAVASKGGRIRPIVVIVKALASSICIGTGGAAGREGPIVQIGSAWGSAVGQVLRFSEERIRTMVACGAAGGIAATFNAPIAGVIFALEVILGEFTAGYFSVVVISSVTASVVTRVMVGQHPAFTVPDYSLRSPWELILYAIMGFLAALIGNLFVRLLYGCEDLFDKIPIPEYYRPVLGGLGVGAIGLFYPHVFGVGYDTIEKVLDNSLLVQTTVALLLLKPLATSLTLGSGGSGGVFAPSLFIGAMLGGSYGHLVGSWFPDITAQPGAYAVVGMAALFSATGRAPISAVLILFEMTGDYRLILPLMLTAVVATAVAKTLQEESVYTLKLARRGTNLRQGKDIDLMQGVRVKDVMDQKPNTIHPGESLSDLARKLELGRRHALPVVDGSGTLVGVVSLSDLHRALEKEKADSMTVSEIATRDIVSVSPQDSMWSALRAMAPRDLSSLPVVDRADPGRLLGVVRRRDIVRAYDLAIMRKQEIQHRVESLRLRDVTGAGLVSLVIGPDSPVRDKSLSTIRLPADAVIVSVQRNSAVLIPRGDTHLRTGDKITLFVKKESEAKIRRLFSTETTPEEMD